jgi:hypothetical protein
MRGSVRGATAYGGGYASGWMVCGKLCGNCVTVCGNCVATVWQLCGCGFCLCLAFGVGEISSSSMAVVTHPAGWCVANCVANCVWQLCVATVCGNCVWQLCGNCVLVAVVYWLLELGRADRHQWRWLRTRLGGGWQTVWQTVCGSCV